VWIEAGLRETLAIPGALLAHIEELPLETFELVRLDTVTRPELAFVPEIL
jgi:hypothetical protein